MPELPLRADRGRSKRLLLTLAGRREGSKTLRELISSSF